MRLKPFLPLIVLAVLLTACQTDFQGDDMPAMENKSLKIKDAKVFFEGHRSAMTRTQGDVMTLGISEKCSPDWSQAVESENEYLYCVEVPLTSGFKFVSTRKRRLGGKEIHLYQDVLRKLLVLKNKQTDEMRMGVVSLVPSVHFKDGRPVTSYDFNHFGDKCGYSGLAIYTNAAGTLVTTDFYRYGERILHHYLSQENPRMDIAKKIMGPVQIYAFDIATRMDEDGFWWCTTCVKYHHKDDDTIECAPVIVGTEICAGCLNYVTSCTCDWNNACFNCGNLNCNCSDYLTCDGCGQSFDYCICSYACNECGEYYCSVNHQAETTEPEHELVNAGRNHISCSDPNINAILDNFMDKNLGRKVYQKIDRPVPIIQNQNHKSALFEYNPNGECRISIGNRGLPADITYILMEELAHAAQFCEHGYDIFRSAKLNFEIEAKVEVCIEFSETDNGYDDTTMNGVYPEEVQDFAQYFYKHGYNDSEDDTFSKEYQDVIDYYRSKSNSNYSNMDKYPENSNYRNFGTFH